MSRWRDILFMQLDPQILAQKKKLQVEIMLKDSDVKKNVRQKIEVEIAIRELKHKLVQTQQDLAVKEVALKKLEAANAQLQNELIKFKHQMNNLR